MNQKKIKFIIRIVKYQMLTIFELSLCQADKSCWSNPKSLVENWFHTF